MELCLGWDRTEMQVYESWKGDPASQNEEPDEQEMPLGLRMLSQCPSSGETEAKTLTLIFHVGFLSLGYDPTALGLPDMALERKTNCREK